MMYDSSRITFGRIIRQARRISLINGGEPSQCPRNCRNRCESGETFTCCYCQKIVPYCCGAADDLPDACDDCWGIYSKAD
ncbi:hypothetical protein [Lyngbya sp. PCC 8106]|uniref:hypothetical protein n=1 Tax=Lyngbya sp. (strain PCC 8106) TaxID=313612 RepID=UPI0018DE4FCC|nr:hypothetical protein [Lyngbya sp. PCC 8106]